MFLTDDGEFRKHYGLSFYDKCKNYIKVFKCLTSCKQMGYSIFRLNFECKCACHEMKTSTVLPYFKFSTNGTTREFPLTYSPRIYDVVYKSTSKGNETDDSDSDYSETSTDSNTTVTESITENSTNTEITTTTETKE